MHPDDIKREELIQFAVSEALRFAEFLSSQLESETEIYEVTAIYGLIEAAFRINPEDASAIAGELDYKYSEPEAKKESCLFGQQETDRSH